MKIHRALVGLMAAGLVVTGGVAYAVNEPHSSSTTSTTSYAPDPRLSRQPQSLGRFGGQNPTTSTVPAATDASDTQEVGVVDINTTVDFGQAKAAGTGMILTSDGEILTNHHVIEGATSISVRVVATDNTYTADVVGYDATNDVAVLQLRNASGLDTVTADGTATVRVGDTIVGVGNANGDGGSASAATGTVSAVDQSITVQSESGGSAERLSNLIQVSADIISGDSGGPLYNADGAVIGMNTAASSGTADVSGFAIPIAAALSIANGIEQGLTVGTVSIGYPAFLGVELQAGAGFGQASSTATVAGVIDGTAAAEAGIAAGSTISALGNTTITDATSLSAAVAKHQPGDSVLVRWTDASGRTHTASITLGQGPVG